MSACRVSEHHPFLVIFRASPGTWSTAVTPSQDVGAAGRGHDEAGFRFHGSTLFPPERLVQVWLRIAFRLRASSAIGPRGRQRPGWRDRSVAARRDDRDPVRDSTDARDLRYRLERRIALVLALDLPLHGQPGGVHFDLDLVGAHAGA